jgi:hypothetical protein
MLSRSRRARWSVATLALGLFAALGFAQAAKPAPPASTQSQKPLSAQQKLDAIIERYEKAEKDWEKAMNDAKTQEESEALDEKRPGNDFLDEIEVVAKEAKGTEVAAKAWSKYATIAAGLGNVKQVATAVDVLVNDHITSPLLTDVPNMLANPRVAKPEKAEEMLRRMIEKSPDKGVQASAMLVLGSRLMGGKKAAPERVAEGRAMLEKLQNEYVGVKSTRGPEYAEIACGKLFELDNLQIGKAPPSFDVTDENGVKFKLSDYKGKVVVIDFWGIW